MPTYSVMRFEQHGLWVLLEDITGRIFHVPRGWLPADVHERDALEVEEEFTQGAHVLRMTIQRPASGALNG